VTVAHAGSGGRVVLAVGGLLAGIGAVSVAASPVVHPAARQEVAGIGLATVMVGMMVVLLGNYLRHAAARASEAPTGTGPGGPPGDGPVQPSSVPTTDTNDTISPG